MKADLVKINARHRADNKNKNLHNKTLHTDEKGLYIIFDKSSWYVKKMGFEEFYESSEYREYLG